MVRPPSSKDNLSSPSDIDPRFGPPTHADSHSGKNRVTVMKKKSDQPRLDAAGNVNSFTIPCHHRNIGGPWDMVKSNHLFVPTRPDHFPWKRPSRVNNTQPTRCRACSPDPHHQISHKSPFPNPCQNIFQNKCPPSSPFANPLGHSNQMNQTGHSNQIGHPNQIGHSSLANHSKQGVHQNPFPPNQNYFNNSGNWPNNGRPVSNHRFVNMHNMYPIKRTSRQYTRPRDTSPVEQSSKPTTPQCNHRSSTKSPYKPPTPTLDDSGKVKTVYKISSPHRPRCRCSSQTKQEDQEAKNKLYKDRDQPRVESKLTKCVEKMIETNNKNLDKPRPVSVSQSDLRREKKRKEERRRSRSLARQRTDFK